MVQDLELQILFGNYQTGFEHVRYSALTLVESYDQATA
jgi:hypothetical protein